jgi:hypothetical protein
MQARTAATSLSVSIAGYGRRSCSISDRFISSFVEIVGIAQLRLQIEPLFDQQVFNRILNGALAFTDEGLIIFRRERVAEQDRRRGRPDDRRLAKIGPRLRSSAVRPAILGEQ